MNCSPKQGYGNGSRLTGLLVVVVVVVVIVVVVLVVAVVAVAVVAVAAAAVVVVVVVVVATATATARQTMRAVRWIFYFVLTRKRYCTVSIHPICQPAASTPYTAKRAPSESITFLSRIGPKVPPTEHVNMTTFK
jgi:hypothetical protein